MTPELRDACEMVFQEHKISGKPISWNKDSFRGRLSFGLSAMAKQTLEGRNIICTLGPSKKSVTVLNPAAASATSFEEAEKMTQNKVPVLIGHHKNEQPEYIAHYVPGIVSAPAGKKETAGKISKGSIKPGSKLKGPANSLISYILLSVVAAVSGALITYLLGLLV